MNWDQVQGKWKEMSGNVKSKWGELTEDEVSEMDGDREALEPFYSNGKGSNERHSKRDACITDNAPHNQTNQMSQTLS